MSVCHKELAITVVKDGHSNKQHVMACAIRKCNRPLSVQKYESNETVKNPSGMCNGKACAIDHNYY